ncbi:GINS complex subunit 2 [Tieghemostelium lacteum]|uniref:GINS complex subunit 2 n=1 Tax=Tieghemostelium lacteum TaxID=361077 RepID=A0A152A926_TIELA|nr:GINS complex subunit 2 [Tieghemostelium lacteum]|eukprot:KYR02631.1 GINS complex subunit 2 [Tieghemostelium lacteum]
MNKLPHVIIQHVLEFIFNNDDIRFILSCISKFKLICKEWNEFVIPKIKLKDIEVKNENMLKLLKLVDKTIKNYNIVSWFINKDRYSLEMSQKVISVFSKLDFTHLDHFTNLQHVDCEIQGNLKMNLKDFNENRCKRPQIQFQMSFFGNDENDIEYLYKSILQINHVIISFSVFPDEDCVWYRDPRCSSSLSVLDIYEVTFHLKSLLDLYDHCKGSLKKLRFENIHILNGNFSKLLCGLVERKGELLQIFKLAGFSIPLKSLQDFMCNFKATCIQIDCEILDFNQTCGCHSLTISNPYIKKLKFEMENGCKFFGFQCKLDLQNCGDIQKLCINQNLCVDITSKFRNLEKVQYFIKSTQMDQYEMLNELINLNLEKLYILEISDDNYSVTSTLDKIHQALQNNCFLQSIAVGYETADTLQKFIEMNHKSIQKLQVTTVPLPKNENIVAKQLGDAFAINSTITHFTIKSYKGYGSSYPLYTTILSYNQTLIVISLPIFHAIYSDFEKLENIICKHPTIAAVSMYSKRTLKMLNKHLIKHFYMIAMEETFTASQIEFLAEDTNISIIPNFKMEELVFLSGEYGPFVPSLPMEVPLWLGISLKKKKKCIIQAPIWMNIEYLEDKYAQENKPGSGFIELPEHFIEISNLILSTAPDDIKDVNKIRGIIEDILNTRQSKLNDSLKKAIESSKENEPISTFTLTNLTMMEINRIRTAFVSGINHLFKLQSSISNTNNNINSQTS